MKTRIHSRDRNHGAETLHCICYIRRKYELPSLARNWACRVVIHFLQLIIKPQ